MPEENDLGSDGEVQCFCNNERETGDMVQYEVCRMVSFECLRMKEGAGVLDGRDFVVSALELTRLVGGLKGR